MFHRVTQGPKDEYRRQVDDLHRRTDWEHGDESRPDPNWEAHGNEPLPAIWGMLDAIMRRPYTRLPHQHD